ncbi:MAG: PAS domain S-box protein, partial [Casimicrobiaceae bacterium]
MNTDTPAVGADAEIAALIATLHRSGQRLEELTGGEVDSVLGPDGRTFVLQRAQEHGRHAEAAKQAAILNALPANIALVDGAGVIVSVNNAWRHFATANLLQGPAFAIGVNYLDVCEHVVGADAEQARHVATCIRRVLRGAIASFSLDYRCDSPTATRRYQLTVSPLDATGLTGAVLMHLDVTANRRIEEDLRLSESKFQQMAQNIHDVFFLQSVETWQIYYVSAAYEQLWGRSCASLYADPMSWMKAIHPEDHARVFKEFALDRKHGSDVEFRIYRSDAEMRWVHLRTVPVLDEAGNSYRTAGIASDITQRKEAEIRIKRLNRVYAVLSGTSSLIVRARDRDELFREACRIAIDVGQFRLAWIGIVDTDSMQVVPVASAGADAGFLDKVAERLSLLPDAPAGHGITVAAIREKRDIVINDVENDSRIAFRGMHATRGLRSLVSLPMMIADGSVATFDLHSGEVGFFDDAELK